MTLRSVLNFCVEKCFAITLATTGVVSYAAASRGMEVYTLMAKRESTKKGKNYEKIFEKHLNFIF